MNGAGSSALLQQRSFLLFWCSRIAATSGYQMLALVIGWQMYALTGSAFDLGLIGLIGMTIYSLNSAAKGSAQVAASGQALMQSQRLAKSVSQALIGSAQATTG